MEEKRQKAVDQSDKASSEKASVPAKRLEDRSPLESLRKDTAKSPAGTWSMRLAIIMIVVLALLVVLGRMLRAV